MEKGFALTRAQMSQETQKSKFNVQLFKKSKFLAWTQH